MELPLIEEIFFLEMATANVAFHCWLHPLENCAVARAHLFTRRATFSLSRIKSETPYSYAFKSNKTLIVGCPDIVRVLTMWYSGNNTTAGVEINFTSKGDPGPLTFLTKGSAVK